jgi:hypothetical protein
LLIIKTRKKDASNYTISNGQIKVQPEQYVNYEDRKKNLIWKLHQLFKRWIISEKKLNFCGFIVFQLFTLGIQLVQRVIIVPHIWRKFFEDINIWSCKGMN